MYVIITLIALGTFFIAISNTNSSISEPSFLDPMVLVDFDFTTRIYHVENKLKNIGDSKIAELISMKAWMRMPI